MESRLVPLSLLASETVYENVSVLPIIKPRMWGKKSFEDGKVMSEMGFEYHIPGHLPSVLPSMMKAGRYTDASQCLFSIVLVALSRAMVCPSVKKPSQQQTRWQGENTHRPRSASSLLIRLRAIMIDSRCGRLLVASVSKKLCAKSRR